MSLRWVSTGKKDDVQQGFEREICRSDLATSDAQASAVTTCHGQDKGKENGKFLP